MNKETIELVKKMVEDGNLSEEIAEKYIPELKENEDERIRKAIIDFFKHEQKEGIVIHHYGVNIDSIIAWLEKQKAIDVLDEEEREFADNVDSYRKEVDASYQKGYNEGVKATLEKKGEQNRPNPFDPVKDFCDGVQEVIKNPINYGLQKRGEKKPVPDWMPKFLDELRSKTNYFDWDEHKDIEGGILAIIKWMNPNYFNEKDGEQKPVEIKPIFEVGDVMRTKDEVAENITDGLPVVVSIDMEYYHCNNELIAIKDQYDYEYPPRNKKQKPAWSEEDEKFFNTALWHLCNSISNGNLTDIRCDTTEWFKSLKDRVQPQNK